MKYKPTIGLEVHAELATESKMFCGCKNQPHESEPNTHTCPVCLAHPGSLPVVNKQAIESVLKFGVAVGATQADYSEFDRKNYFYPDIPKAYQISQYKFPFLMGGSLRGIELTRVHLEEDTARSSHEHLDGSLVDFNRAGVPLMELVTEPVIHDAATAGAFARELQLLLQTIGISEANMERGEMRIEANISVSETEQMATTYVEVKNINSFKAVEAAIDFEIARQIALIEAGESLSQETRGWDENKGQTFSQRSKETAKDYRYFPDPDLPKILTSQIHEFQPDSLSEKMPLLPEKKREIYSKIGISLETTETLIANKKADQIFLAIVDIEGEDSVELLKTVSNYLSVDLVGLDAIGAVDLKKVNPQILSELMKLVVAGDLGSRGAKDVLTDIVSVTEPVRDYVEQKSLLQLSDDTALQPLAIQIIAENPEQVAEYKAGKETVLKYLLGQGMKLSKGAANPASLEKILISEITK